MNPTPVYRDVRRTERLGARARTSVDGAVIHTHIYNLSRLRDSLSVEEDLDRSFPLDPAPGRALIRDLDEEHLRGLIQ
jgi:hypothetical protein